MSCVLLLEWRQASCETRQSRLAIHDAFFTWIPRMFWTKYSHIGFVTAGFDLVNVPAILVFQANWTVWFNTVLSLGLCVYIAAYGFPWLTVSQTLCWCTTVLQCSRARAVEWASRSVCFVTQFASLLSGFKRQNVVRLSQSSSLIVSSHTTETCLSCFIFSLPKYFIHLLPPEATLLNREPFWNMFAL